MDIKKCTKCEIIKPLDDYHRNKNNKDGRNYYCKDCMREIARNHHKTNEAYSTRQKLSKAKLTEINREFLWKYLNENPCEHCGIDDPRVLEFDHIEQSTKTADISYLVTRSSLETLMEEVAKCRVLCANCHRIRTAIQLNYWWTKLV